MRPGKRRSVRQVTVRTGPGHTHRRSRFIDGTKGTNGTSAKCRARWIASRSARWCLAQTPDLRRGSIFARSEMNRRIRSTSL